jgi:hypothetical protein
MQRILTQDLEQRSRNQKATKFLTAEARWKQRGKAVTEAKRIQPRNTRNTRKTGPALMFFPRIPRIPRFKLLVEIFASREQF